MRVLGVIPARYQSTRLPGKPLIDILGKSMIQRVYEQAIKCTKLDHVIVATDNEKIVKHIKEFGGDVVLTSSKHESGTDRCNEAVMKIKKSYDIVVNIQGDEPLINPVQIEEIVNLFKNNDVKIATLANKIDDKSIMLDENNPKVVVDDECIAIDFCRTIRKTCAKKKYYKHLGIYAFRSQVLKKICKLKQTKKEIKESLEQLRWLENGYKIKVGITKIKSISVDTIDDLEKIRQIIR